MISQKAVFGGTKQWVLISSKLDLPSEIRESEFRRAEWCIYTYKAKSDHLRYFNPPAQCPASLMDTVDIRAIRGLQYSGNHCKWYPVELVNGGTNCGGGLLSEITWLLIHYVMETLVWNNLTKQVLKIETIITGLTVLIEYIKLNKWAFY